VLYPSRGLFVLGIDSVDQIGNDGLEPEFATGHRPAYNDGSRTSATTLPPACSVPEWWPPMM